MRPFEQGKVAGESMADLFIKQYPKLQLTNYNAAWYFEELMSIKDVVYFEHPMKNGALGFTEADDLGVSIIIDSNLSNRERKNFTIAHEIGHVMFHINQTKTYQSYLETSNTLSLFDDNEVKHLKETEANAFAANFLLPDRVLRNQILSSMNAYHIKKVSGISIEALRWRIVDYLINTEKKQKVDAIDISQEFVKEYTNSSASNTSLYHELKKYPSIKPNQSKKQWTGWNILSN